MANPQRSAVWVLVVFTIITLVSYFYAPKITEWSKTAGLVESIIVYIITNPVYMSVFIYLSTQYQLRGFLSSLFIVLALDIQSLPHVVVDGVTQEPTTYLFIDSIISRYFHTNIFVLYVVLPLVLMFVAYELISPGQFVKAVRRYSG